MILTEPLDINKYTTCSCLQFFSSNPVYSITPKGGLAGEAFEILLATMEKENYLTMEEVIHFLNERLHSTDYDLLYPLVKTLLVPCGWTGTTRKQNDGGNHSCPTSFNLVTIAEALNDDISKRRIVIEKLSHQEMLEKCRIHHFPNRYVFIIRRELPTLAPPVK